MHDFYPDLRNVFGKSNYEEKLDGFLIFFAAYFDSADVRLDILNSGQKTPDISEILAQGRPRCEYALPICHEGKELGILRIAAGEFTLKRMIEAGRERISLAMIMLAQTLMLQRRLELCLTDELTGLLNRRGLTERLEQELKRHARLGRRLSVLFIDIDKFKAINDNFGHAAGDQVLRRLAWTLSKILRGADITARIGGDEFIVLAPETNLCGAEEIGRKIQQTIKDANPSAPGFTVSIGVCVADGSEDVATIFSASDEKMYSAKRNGGDSSVV